MKDVQTLGVAHVARLFEEVIPDRRDQMTIFRQLTHSVAECHRIGSRAWSVSLLDRGFRLNVGNVEAMSLSVEHHDTRTARDMGMDHEFTFVTVRVLLASAEPPLDTRVLGEVGNIDPMDYASVAVPNWCYSGTFVTSAAGQVDPSRGSVEEHLVKIRPAHRRFLEQACRTPTGKMRERSNYAQHHCQALYDYAVSLTGTHT